MFNIWPKKEKNISSILLPDKLPEMLTSDKDDHQTYFKMSLDEAGNIFVDVNCEPGDEENLAVMCTALNTGMFSDMIVYGIENGLTETQSEIVLNRMFEDNKKIIERNQADDEDPVISPLIALQVLNGQNTRDS